MTQAGIIVKVTRLCNMGCTYCLDRRTAGETMTFPVLARLISSALQAYDSVQFIWHGGETTLVPIEFYKKAMALQARYLRPGCRVRNDIQSNGTRIDDAWAEFFRENRFGVGVSFDGPKELHDRRRRYAGGQSSHADVLRGLETLARHGIPASILLVVDDATLALGPEAIFAYCIEQGIKKLGCLAAKPHVGVDAGPGTPADHYVTPGQMTGFLCRLYDCWLDRGDPEVHIREIDAILARLDGKKIGYCTLEGSCFGHFFVCEPDGDLAHCDLFVNDPRYCFGNIRKVGFAEIAESEALRSLKAENDAAVDVMRSHCPEFRTCSGGCPFERYVSYRHNPYYTDTCCGQYELISYIRARRPPPRQEAPQGRQTACGEAPQAAVDVAVELDAPARDA